MASFERAGQSASWLSKILDDYRLHTARRGSAFRRRNCLPGDDFDVDRRSTGSWLWKCAYWYGGTLFPGCVRSAGGNFGLDSWIVGAAAQKEIQRPVRRL